MAENERKDLTLSVIMPCLNEENTVGLCVDEALAFMKDRGITGEVLVVDNGSTDCSAETALRHGAVVITEPRPGYGRAIRTGLAAGRGRLFIIGDCDKTYDFRHMDEMYGLLERGECDMVIGNRYTGGLKREPCHFPTDGEYAFCLIAAENGFIRMFTTFTADSGE